MPVSGRVRRSRANLVVEGAGGGGRRQLPRAQGGRGGRRGGGLGSAAEWELGPKQKRTVAWPLAVSREP